MLKIQPKKEQDTELDQAAIELSSVNGEKARAQAELEAIIANSRRIEAENIQKAQEHAAVFAQKKADGEAELAQLEKRKKNARATLSDMDAEQKEMSIKIQTARENHDEMRIQLSAVSKAHADASDNCRAMEQHKKKLEIDATSLTMLVEELKNSQKSLIAENAELQKKNDEHIDKAVQGARVHVDISSKIDAGEKKLAETEKAIAVQETKRAEAVEACKRASNDLAEIQDEILAAKKDQRESVERVNARLEVLGLAETRITEKLEMLKEAKKEFTADHLIRMGMKD